MAKITDFTDHRLARVLAAISCDVHVLGKVVQSWEPRVLEKAPEVVATLCVDYHRKYQKAPGVRGLRGLLHDWADKNQKNPALDTVERLSEQVEAVAEKEQSNSEYLVDMVGEYLSQAKLNLVLEKAGSLNAAGKVKEAEVELSSFRRVKMDSRNGIFVFKDFSPLDEVFDRTLSTPLFEYPGALGSLLRGTFVRENFVAFLAGEGVGKSFYLLDVVWRILFARKRVALFEVGDMTQRQVYQRILPRAADRPMDAGTVRFPVSIGPTGARWEEKEFRNYMNKGDAIAALENVIKRRIKSKNPEHFYLSNHSNASLSVQGIRQELTDLERDGWVPDAVVLDYADNLADPPGFREQRDKINENWKQLRRLSQDLHCLLVTATQATRLSYEAATMRKKHVADDKRKLAHVSHLIGLLQSDQEKGVGIYRVNLLKDRNKASCEGRHVYVTGCLALADPVMVSWEKKGEKQ